MSGQAILAIDQGTTSSRAIVFSLEGEIISLWQKELKLSYPHKSWVEQDPEDIWADTLWAARHALQDAEGKGYDVKTIGITNQRETTIIWDKQTGKPVYNAIVWQDRRTADLCAKLKSAGKEEMITAKTGLLLDPYFSASKVAWILDNVEGARTKAESGQLAFGTVDSFLLWHLTGGKVHASDATNASRTMLYNIIDGRWDDELLELFNIPKSLLPDVKDNMDAFGTAEAALLGRDLPIGGMAGDQQSALIGQTCFRPGMVKSTYGTGCFVLMNIGETPKISQNRLLTTIGYQLDGKVTYALEGAIFVAGAAVQWLRDNVNFFEHAADSEKLARSVDDSNGVYFVPAFTGLGAPYWAPEAKAAILGLSRESNAAHITRAALEAQAYQTSDLMAAFRDDSGQDITTLRVDGGLVENEFVCQIVANIIDCRVERPAMTETTAMGAAYLAGVQAGLFDDFDALSEHWQSEKAYTSQINQSAREDMLSGWKIAVNRVL